MTTKKIEPVKGLAFYHRDGLTAAYQHAKLYAGDGGRVATMPDIVQARLNSIPGGQSSPWEKYYTSLTAEYLGYSRGGKKILIVAHGIGPMANIEGIQKAYSWQYKDKSRNRRGGRITQEEFWDLEDGKFGKVEIIDFEEYLKRYQYSFVQVLPASWAETDPVLLARLGPQGAEYVRRHAEIARAWHREKAGIETENTYQTPPENHKKFLDTRKELHLKFGAQDSDPFVISVNDESNCSYKYTDIEDGYAIAHLISTGALCNLHHEGYESLVLDFSCHAWTDGARLVGIPAGGEGFVNITDGPDPHQLLRRYWKELMQEVPGNNPLPFCRLMDFSGQLFTQYQKVGAAMDTGDPEYLVISAKKIEKPVIFRTTIGGYHMFFKYDINEMKAIAPPLANAYEIIGEPQIEGSENHVANVQFYQVEADTSKRLLRIDALARDYEKMMSLANRK